MGINRAIVIQLRDWISTTQLNFIHANEIQLSGKIKLEFQTRIWILRGWISTAQLNYNRVVDERLDLNRTIVIQQRVEFQPCSWITIAQSRSNRAVENIF